MTTEQHRKLRRMSAMRQPVRLTMGEMATIRHALIVQHEAFIVAAKPFVYQVLSEGLRPLDDALGAITEARCNLKRRQHPDYNPAGDSECSGYATDAEYDEWAEKHPESKP